MARLVGADAESTRARILCVASHLFAEHGEGNTSMRDIGRAAGVSLATVHHYFGSKNELYRAEVDHAYRQLEALRDEIARSISLDRPIEEEIARAVRASSRFACDHRPAVRLVMRTVIDTEELPEERKSGLLLPFLDEGTELLSRFVDEPRERIRLLLHAVNHLVVRYALTAPRELAVVVGLKNGSEQEAMRRIEDHLVFATLRLFGLPKVRAAPKTEPPGSS